MVLFSSFFESPQIKRQKQLVRSATILREQAARDLWVEVSILVTYLNAATKMHQKACLAGNSELAGKFVVTLAKPTELLERLERVRLELEKDIEERKRVASSAADFEALATFELELRDALTQIKKEVKQHLTDLGCLNSQAAQFFSDIAK